MELTGKAKRKFLNWVKIRVNSKLHEIEKIEYWFIIQDESFKNALIIEWFDSVGIYIENTYSEAFDNSISFHAKVNKKYVNHEVKDYPINIFNSRQEAIKQAIIKANKIYNERFK